MEALFAKHLMPSMHANFSMRWHLKSKMSQEFLKVTLIPGRLFVRKVHPWITPSAKRSDFQDFQDFSKPLRLLPVSTANTYTECIFEEGISSVDLDNSSAFYLLELHTSKDFGSSLRDENAAILLCLIDANGDSILQRISSASLDHFGEGTIATSETIHFQRGSIDVVTFKGSKLARIEALWIGLESGSWRLDGVRLTVFYGPLSRTNSVEGVNKGQNNGLQYRFEADNLLLGEKGVSVAEMRPVVVTELSEDKLSAFLIASSSEFNSPLNRKASKEESMREYADLKFSLLLYDLVLISSGSTIVTFSANEKAGYAFLVGGICGFLYLLLLQRSVDGLSPPTPPSFNSQVENILQKVGGFKGPILSLTLILVTSIVAVKYGIGGASVSLMPSDLFVGVGGFLTCKIAVVLAAFKPLRRSFKEK